MDPMRLSPNKSAPSQISELLHLAAEEAIRYVENAFERRVGPALSNLAGLTGFHEPFPADPCNPVDVLPQLDALGYPATVTITGGRYLGLVNGGLVPAAPAASWM